jgi:hypothetical protein
LQHLAIISSKNQSLHGAIAYLVTRLNNLLPA